MKGQPMLTKDFESLCFHVEIFSRFKCFFFLPELLGLRHRVIPCHRLGVVVVLDQDHCRGLGGVGPGIILLYVENLKWVIC